jgi:glycosyltransferase involved in cell wall biosynthesis
MKILWITNTVFPELAIAMGQEKPVVGGWMYSLAKDLVKKGIHLSVATVKKNTKEYKGKINGIDYYLMNGIKSIEKYDRTLEDTWQKLVEEIQPNLVHVHGTEYGHGLALLKTQTKLKLVISIQGMTSVYARYYKGQLSLKNIVTNLTLKDILRRNSILDAQRKFEIRGAKIELQYLKLGNNFIGRTKWDYHHVKTNNPNANYYFCNESLRDEFYAAPKWHVKNMKKNTIFLSQALYPIKGLHKVLEALEIVKRNFPDVKVRIAGMNIIKTDTLQQKLRIGGYGSYIKKLVKKKALSNQICFTGPLNANEMVNEYLNCNVFICPSSIENSPNSLGEAQLLGVPCIASYVGGIPDMVSEGNTGLLYRFEEIEMLAQNIISVFSNVNLATRLSRMGIEEASKRHDREINSDNTIKIYKHIQNVLDT